MGTRGCGIYYEETLNFVINNFKAERNLGGSYSVVYGKSSATNW